ncbi:hypothetical protein OPIT5_09440 [Opitutaceae bacterium TAV5]|nr:hypothetical protein OPIT5_09440 [Opitutaceae bacterium TAV5]
MHILIFTEMIPIRIMDCGLFETIPALMLHPK